MYCVINFEQPLRDLYQPLSVLKGLTRSNFGYGLLLQDMAKLSDYFCEKACDDGLVNVLLVTINSYQRFILNEVSILAVRAFKST